MINFELTEDHIAIRNMVREFAANEIAPYKDLAELVPKKDWVMFPHWLIYHGRRVCNARKPKCEECYLESMCPKIGAAK